MALLVLSLWYFAIQDSLTLKAVLDSPGRVLVVEAKVSGPGPSEVRFPCNHDVCSRYKE